MTMTIKRRRLIQILGSGVAATALAPFIPTLEGDAVAQDGVTRRYLLWYTPTMPASKIVDPLYQSSPGSLSLTSGEAFDPLNSIADRLLLVRNLNNLAAKDNKVSGGHKTSGVTLLSGYAMTNATQGIGELIDGKGLPHSTLDQWLASQLEKQPIPFLGMGHPATGNFFAPTIWNTSSVREGLPVSYLPSPAAVFETLFGVTDANGVDNLEVARNKSVLDHVYRSVQGLHTRVSAVDRIRVEAHLDAIRAIEKKLDASVQCDLRPELSASPARMDEVQDLYIELVSRAFACDLTRVSVAMFHAHLNNYSYDFLGHDMSENYHSVTHGSGSESTSEKEQFLRDVLRWRATQFVKLVETLESTPSAEGGSVLDSTIVHWTSEVGKDHKWHDLPTFLTSGGYFRPGQMIEAQRNESGEDAPLNRLHTSIARAMGFNLEHFGDPKYGSGGLPSQAVL